MKPLFIMIGELLLLQLHFQRTSRLFVSYIPAIIPNQFNTVKLTVFYNILLPAPGLKEHFWVNRILQATASLGRLGRWLKARRV